MTRRGTARAGAAVVALMLLATACSGSSGDDATTTSTTAAATSTTEVGPPPDAIAVDDWADSFCASFDDWSSAISEAETGIADDVAQGDLSGSRDAVEELFSSASEATGTLIDEVEAGGVPEVIDGDLLVDDLVERFEGFRDTTDDAGTKAAALPVDDPKAFRSELATLRETFKEEATKVGASFDKLDADYPSAELKRALEDSCTPP